MTELQQSLKTLPIRGFLMVLVAIAICVDRADHVCRSSCGRPIGVSKGMLILWRSHRDYGRSWQWVLETFGRFQRFRNMGGWWSMVLIVG